MNISELEYCFLIYPRFYQDFNFLKEKKVLEHINDGHCKWLLSELSLIEYFCNIDPADSYAKKTSIIDWRPVETLFDLDVLPTLNLEF